MIGTSRHPLPTTTKLPGRHRIDEGVAAGAMDSPYAAYLRRWLGRQTRRHRELLLNIEAASRIRRGLVSTRREG